MVSATAIEAIRRSMLKYWRTTRGYPPKPLVGGSHEFLPLSRNGFLSAHDRGNMPSALGTSSLLILINLLTTVFGF